MRRLGMGLISVMGLAFVAAGCGVEDATETETETTEGAVTNSQTFRWSQGQAAVVMGSASNRVCFLTGMKGKFGGGGESVWVRINAATNNWELTGSSQQTGVGGEARCTTTGRGATLITAGSYSGEFSWAQGQGATNMGSTADRICFLTRVSGRFEGGGEMVRTRISGASWLLDGTSQQVGVSARARCVSNVGYIPTETSWTQGSPAARLEFTSLPNSHGCFLSRVKGKFAGGGESVTVFYSPTALFPGWYVSGTSQQTSVGAGGRCFH